MTTNYNKIKSMSIEEMAEYLRIQQCSQCEDEMGGECTYDGFCNNKNAQFIKQWLQAEAEE